MAKTLFALIVSLCIAFSAAAAQSKPSAKKAPQPQWSQLTPAQQGVLAPLQRDWEELDTTRRKKWIAIADRYPTMKPASQKRLQKRMQEWAQLTPQERQEARERYKRMRKLSRERRNEIKDQWEESQTAGPGPTPESTPSSSPAPATEARATEQQ